jgi:hypothetical protein
MVEPWGAATVPRGSRWGAAMQASRPFCARATRLHWRSAANYFLRQNPVNAGPSQPTKPLLTIVRSEPSSRTT